MWRLFSIFLFLLAVPQTRAQSSAQPNSEQSRVLALENAWNQAVQQKNKPALEMLLGSELIYIDYDGKLMGKAEYLASVQSELLHPARIVSESMDVHLYGAAAVVTGVYRESGAAKDGKPYLLRERFTDTWVRRSESWICVASQSTLIP
jgi:ketosteroid isomerase-like protein